jgi:hypothetical protein
MKTGTVLHTSAFALLALLTVGACAARAQEPPTLPPPTQPPATPPATGDPALPQGAQPPAQPSTLPPAPPATTQAAVPAPVVLTDSELRRRRDAIYLMEGLLVNTVKLAATRTQSQIEEAIPELSVTLFSAVPPQANGFHLDDYGVVFNVVIPTYQPSVVNLLNNMLPRSRPDAAAQPTSASRPPSTLPFNPDAIYVETVRDSLIDAMLKFGQSLELRPAEWLAIAARGADGGPGPVSEPSVLILRVRGHDLNEFLAGRLSRGDVEKRVQMKPFSGRR